MYSGTRALTSDPEYARRLAAAGRMQAGFC